MARPAQDEFQVLRQQARIVAAALELYRSRGYEAVTLRQVAAQVGISHVTPYRYFKSKEELIAAIRTAVCASFGEHLDKADPKGADPLVRLRAICLALVDFACHYPEDYRLIYSLRQPPLDDYLPLREVRLRVMHQVISVFQQAIDAGRLKGDAADLAHIAWASIHGLMSLHVANQLVYGRTLAMLVEGVLRMLLPGIPVADVGADVSAPSQDETHADRTSTPRR